MTDQPAELNALADEKIIHASASLPLDTSVPDKVPETEMEHQAPGWRLSPSGQQSEVKIILKSTRCCSVVNLSHYPGTRVGGSLTYDTKIKTSVADLHWDPDPDLAFYLNADRILVSF